MAVSGVVLRSKGLRVMIYSLLIIVLEGVALVTSMNVTAPGGHDPNGDQTQSEDKPFPAWLIGVIILSILAVVVAVATIVQRILRRRTERMEEYRMAS